MHSPSETGLGWNKPAPTGCLLWLSRGQGSALPANDTVWARQEGTKPEAGSRIQAGFHREQRGKHTELQDPSSHPQSLSQMDHLCLLPPSSSSHSLCLILRL